jgi:dipeptidyl aminopeptidase/acylaminoacyl peptidase
MISSFLAKSLIKPTRQPVVKNPKDYGMDYKNIEYKTADGVLIKGWLIPGKSDKLIIMTHPMPFTRYGFSVKHQGFFKITKREVELLNTVKNLNNAGYNILTIDLRNHGESGAANSGFCGIGLLEYEDVIGVMDYVAARDDLKNKLIGFVSLCTGANATIIAMSKASGKFKNVKCMIAVQPVSADVFSKCILKAKYPMFLPMYNGINKKVKKYTGYYLEDLSPKNYIKDLKVPIMYVQVEHDPWSNKENIEGFFNNTKTEKKLLWIEGEERFDGYNYFGKKPEEMTNFLKKYL